jgi:hypothetical protein
MWTKISLEPAQITLHKSGKITWNTPLQLALKSPLWVDVMWDDDNRRIGIRTMTKQVGFPVIHEAQDGEYKILSAEALTLAGISVEENITATAEYNAGIQYITIP